MLINMGQCFNWKMVITLVLTEKKKNHDNGLEFIPFVEIDYALYSGKIHVA